MKIFEFRDRLVEDYAAYIKSFIQIRDQRMCDYVNASIQADEFRLHSEVLNPQPRLDFDAGK